MDRVHASRRRRDALGGRLAGVEHSGRVRVRTDRSAGSGPDGEESMSCHGFRGDSTH